MMKIGTCGLIVVVSLAWLQAVYGGYCTRQVCTSERRRECAYRTWQGCCVYRWVWRPVIKTIKFCCTGFTGRNCETPICSPPCQNGGRCSRPGVCDCTSNFIGPDCTNSRPCSVESPCYPGSCSGSCRCQTNFTGDSCLQRVDDPPQIFQSRVRLVSLKVSTDPTLNGMRMYELFTDSSNPSVDVVDTIWCNQDGFNYLEIYGTAQYDPQGLSPQPAYVRNAQFGIVRAVANITHTKLSTVVGRGRYTDSTENYPCNEVKSNTISALWVCTSTDKMFTIPINNADELDVAFKFTSGGSRTLQDPSTGRTRNPENYQELSAQKRMKFRFDLEFPVHCSRTGCREQPLSVREEITKAPVVISWSGWNDALSGMFRYAWEIFKLEPYTKAGELRELRPLQPIRHTPFFVSNGSLPVTYTPPEPGVYSVILEASDLANNSRYARRFFIYDTVSNVTTRTDQRLFVSSAADSTMNTWQAELDNDIIVDWSGHFVNLLHHEKKFLNAILEYPPQFTDVRGDGRFTQKTIEFDDNEGNRTTYAINNADGIVKFEISHAQDHEGGATLINPTSWRVIDNIGQRFVISGQRRSNGDSIRVWVRASDVMGNQLVDSTLVSFDNTPPVLTTRPLTRNVKNGVFPYSSILGLDTFDEESGIWGVTWRLSRDSNGDVMRTGQLDLSPYRISRSECDARPVNCRCTPTKECFLTTLDLPINHCWLVVEKESLGKEVITMEINATNPAMLTKTRTIQIRDLENLDGIGEYAAPKDVRVIRGGFNTVRIAWNNTESCYNVTELWVQLPDDPVKQKVHRLSKFYDITGLKPETNYTAFLITGYSGEMSDRVAFAFSTGPAPKYTGLSAGAGAGIGIGILLLLIIVCLVLMWYFGIIAVITGKKDKKPMTKAAVAFSRMSRKMRGAAVDDDIYILGGDNFDIPLGAQFSSSRLTLEELITEGQFARIYKASLAAGEQDVQTVVAKLVKESGDPEARQMMKGKILFYLNEIGENKNILRMLGAVMDNEDWGPVMVLEYCEMGTMKSWLVKQKGAVNDDVIERLFQFSYGIVQGMAYLAQAGVVHRRLAARNILLTFLLDVRITGFGPTNVAEGDEDDKTQERIPVRWVAPECVRSTRNATEKADVWSFGVVLWEIFSLGETPYPALKTHEIPVKVKGGHRMDKPELADEFNYTMMQQCWNIEPRRRPKFRELEKSYRRLMTGGGDDGNTYSNYSFRKNSNYSKV